MKIILDAMSGDYAPFEILKGAAAARDEFDSHILLVGQRETVFRAAEEENISLDGMDFVDAPDQITMEDKPSAIMKEKKNSSMGVGLRLLTEGKGDAFVSAGNTGALALGATFILRRVPGIARPGIATIMPLRAPVLLLDSGANLNVSPEDLLCFAKMGALCMERVYGVQSPRIGLLNNGAEPTKGHPLQVDTYTLLKNSDMNFVGNVEAKDLPFDACDVVVTDGFTGNIVLKFLEGMGRFMLLNLRDMFYSNTKTKVSAFMMKDKIGDMKRRFDATEYGGAPLLGVTKPVIKAHGSSNARAIKNAIRQAESFVNTGFVNELTEWAAGEYASLRASRMQKQKEEALTEKKTEEVG